MEVKIMGSYYHFQRYIDFNYVTFDELTLIANYICSNLNAPRVELEKIFLKNNVSDCFFRRPKHKSCFTSMQKYKFSYFCTECKKISFFLNSTIQD